MANLVIVESPAKANTIKGYLGSSYKVVASKGHIRDLPKSTLGIDVERGFEPHYINIRGKSDVIKDLKRDAKEATKIFLATDPDREGEAISWHIAKELGIPEDRACRVCFNEITKNAVKAAIKNPRKIDIDLVNSQQARRILDRLVGFNLSQVLWKSIGSGLSGGRVQSVAARIIAERETEIKDFVPQEYWTVDATLTSASGDTVIAKLWGDKSGKIRLENEKQASYVLSRISQGDFCAKSVKHQERLKQPSAPFTTSTLQQEASKRLGFQSSKTMKVAQELYDGLNLGPALGGFVGLITYMRTDSTRISADAQKIASDYILENYGEAYLPDSARVFKTRTGAQDAHEAIRPSIITLTPKDIKRALTADQYKLYKLIWDRFIASQMAPAVLDTVSFDIENSGYIFKSSGHTLKFSGYMSVYGVDDEDSEDEELAKLPVIKRGETLRCDSVVHQQHFTEAPARYTEASLIKFLEENGIGRPSTYAPIISIIISRDYVRRDGKTLVGTELGTITTSFMKEHFPEIVDYEFTASMENSLDSIENGQETIVEVIGEFWKRFEREIEQAVQCSKEKSSKMPLQESEYDCPLCSKKMVYKTGRFGRFLACPDYPKCKSTVAVDKDGAPLKREEKKATLAGFKCELCGSEMVERRGKFGVFYACSNYPKCKFTKQKTVELDVNCPKCQRKLVGRYTKENSLVYSCSGYPECDFSSWDRPMNEKCPRCGEILYFRKSKSALICKNKGCDYIRAEDITND